MNYFEYYNLPVSLEVDTQLLKQAFYTKSKSFHPDFFTLDGIDAQMEALEESTFNNNAYKTLIDEEKRLKYFLDLHHIMDEEGKNSLPQEFLFEMMEVNEAIMELQLDPQSDAIIKLRKEIDEKKAELKASVQSIFGKEAKNISEHEFGLLRDYYLKNKYMLRLEQNMEKFS